ncbi:hypothetical protein C0Q70_07753 [Pomacea canaliculata]|uniref:Sodium/phosphate cotransporter 2B n=1 Tax=Pomacea canaliculata TaxID=400727 RepID=A0A2T7PG16_POMCA|nr:hypothetical protein C0Q70_07753 [Pomacea canaliculata]
MENPAYGGDGDESNVPVVTIENGIPCSMPEGEKEEDDPWKVTSLKMDYVPWKSLTAWEKLKRTIGYFIKIALVLGFLYLFICSLDFLSSAFRLLGVLTIKTAIPIVMGANIGTSITNTIVSLGQITNEGDFRRAFAGATIHDMFNWLTVLVLLPIEIITGYLYRLSEAIVDSMNLKETLDVDKDLLKVITKPFTELIIQVSSSGITNIATGAKAADQTLMKLCCDKIKPAACCSTTLKDLQSFGSYDTKTNFTKLQKANVCKSVSTCVMKQYTDETLPAACFSKPWMYKAHKTPVTLMRPNCKMMSMTSSANQIASAFYQERRNATDGERASLCSSIQTCFTNSSCTSSWTTVTENRTVTGQEFSCKTWSTEVERSCNTQCEFLFRPLHDTLSDEAVGGILLVLSLFLLCLCLVLIVKLLHTLLQGPMAMAIKKFVNADFPGYCGYFTGYLALLLGAGFTILVQSSSIFTSTLTPLVGIGVIELERMYPLTLGSNIGTTMTGILAALAQDVDSIPRSLKVAFCHLFFNISGILIFYPFSFFRPPIPLAKFLGNTTARYRWFSIVYLLFMFFIFPAAIFALSIPGWYVLAAVLIPIAALIIFVCIIKFIQSKRPSCLPPVLQNWKALPKPLRSLEPYDRAMKKLCFCDRFQEKEEQQGIPLKNSEANNSTRL